MPGLDKFGFDRSKDFWNRWDYEELTADYQRLFLEESLLIVLLRDVIRDLRRNYTNLQGQFRVIELLAGAGRVLRAIRDALFSDDSVSAFLGRECGADRFEETIQQVDRIYRGDELLTYTPRLAFDFVFLVHVLYLFKEEQWARVFEQALGWTKRGGIVFVVMRNDRSTGTQILESLGAKKFGELNAFIDTVTSSGRVKLLDRREVGFSRLLREVDRARIIRYWLLDRAKEDFSADKVPTWENFDDLVEQISLKAFANQELLIFQT